MSSSFKTAVRTKPELWERVKRDVLKSPKGGVPGKWSARKAQLAVAAYKAKGGGYKGPKSRCNSLAVWSREDWGYINNSSRGKSRGRYLPRRVRDRLTPAERREENRRKGSRKGQWIPYSRSVATKFRQYRKQSACK